MQRLPTSFFLRSYSTKKPTQFLENIDYQTAFKDKKTSDILLALFVYKVCSFPSVIERTPQLLSTLERMKLSKPVYAIGRQTFFKHFCGGEEASATVPKMKQLQASNIKSILDLSIEADLPPSKESTLSPKEQKIRDYAAQQLLSDKIVAMLKECIVASKVDPANFSAIKVTSLTHTEVLKNLSTLLKDQTKLYLKYADKEGLDFDSFEKMISHYPNQSYVKRLDLKSLFEANCTNGKMDYISLRRTFSIHSSHRAIFVAEESEYDALIHDIDMKEIESLQARLTDLAQIAEANNVSLMVDAEQTYFQPAIDSFALYLMDKFNRRESKPLIAQTYQMYLKDSFNRLQTDLEESKRYGFQFGAKLVRGAYMVSERERAEELNIEDPIQPSIQDTHSNYNRGVTFVLEQMQKTPANSNKIHLTVASHNVDSVKMVVQAMHDLNLNKTHPTNISFGQLLGMCDFISYSLGRNGYQVYKYVPYGPIREVFPYLIRRAQENSSVLNNTTHDQYFLKQELRRRFFNK